MINNETTANLKSNVEPNEAQLVMLPRHEIYEVRLPLVGFPEGGGRLCGDHEDGTHRMDVAVRRLALCHLQCGDACRRSGH